MCVLAFAAQAVHAGDDKLVADEKDLKKIIEDQGIYVETAKKGIVLSGYVDTSYTYGFAGTSTGPVTAPPGPVGGVPPTATPAGVLLAPQTQVREGGNTTPAPSSEARLRAFDVDNNDFNINAFKLALEKALPDENTWAAGFRADLMFGEDAGILNGQAFTDGGVAAQPFGNNSGITDAASYFFLEQAYAQFRIPIGNGLDIKFGKFVTLLGYEVIESPANLNFSRSLLFQNAIPLTHTGFIASYQWNDIIDTQLGLVNNWNSSDTGGPFSGIDGFGKAVTGRIGINNPGGNATIAISGIYSPDGEATRAGVGALENESVWVVDIWGQWAPKFANDKLLLAFNGDYGQGSDMQADTFLGGPASIGDTWWGVALYAKYQFTDVFSLATRGEYFYDETGAKVGFPGQVDAWAWTVTAGFDVWENLLVRLEYRYDMFPNTTTVIATPAGFAAVQENDDQHQIALNIVYTF